MKTKPMTFCERLALCREVGRQMREDVVAIAAQCGISREEIEKRLSELRVTVR